MLPPYNVSPRSSIGEFQSSDSRSLDWNSVRSQHILQQSIHFLMFIWVAGQHFKQPRTPAILVRHWGVPKQSQRDNLSSMSWVYPEAYFQLNIPKTPLPRKRLGNTLGIPDRPKSPQQPLPNYQIPCPMFKGEMRWGKGLISLFLTIPFIGHASKVSATAQRKLPGAPSVGLEFFL